MQSAHVEPGRNESAGLSRTVWALGVVSFFTDVAGDMVFPLLPRFLAGMQGAGAAAVGIVEGTADAAAQLAKPWAGSRSDRGRRKPFVLAGYAISGVARPALALAGSVLAAGVLRAADRIGKGIRSAPRDALIAEVTAPAKLARAFSLHRAMDHAGAVVGPLLAAGLLALGLGLRQVFLVAAVPGVLAFLTIVFFVRESKLGPDTGSPAAPVREAVPSGTPLPPRLVAFLWIAFLFALGASTDALLLLRAEAMGVRPELVPLLWGALHVVKVLASYPGGAFADRAGHSKALLLGWIVYAAVYAGFATVDGAAGAWILFLAYGFHHGLSEGAEKAIVAKLAPAGARGRALGLFALALGAGTLLASASAGLLYRFVGPVWAFGTGAVAALTASVALAVWARGEVSRGSS